MRPLGSMAMQSEPQSLQGPGRRSHVHSRASRRRRNSLLTSQNRTVSTQLERVALGVSTVVMASPSGADTAIFRRHQPRRRPSGRAHRRSPPERRGRLLVELGELGFLTKKEGRLFSSGLRQWCFAMTAMTAMTAVVTRIGSCSRCGGTMNLSSGTSSAMHSSPTPPATTSEGSWRTHRRCWPCAPRQRTPTSASSGLRSAGKPRLTLSGTDRPRFEYRFTRNLPSQSASSSAAPTRPATPSSPFPRC